MHPPKRYFSASAAAAVAAAARPAAAAAPAGGAAGGARWAAGAGGRARGCSGGAGKPSPKNWALIAHKIYIFTPSRTSRTPKLNNYFSFPQSPRRVKKDIYAG